MLPWKEAGTACLTQGVQNASKSLPRQMAISPNQSGACAAIPWPGVYPPGTL